MRLRAPQLAGRVPVFLCLFLVGAVQRAAAQDAIPLPQGQVGKSYSTNLNADHGRGPFRWRVTSGHLPLGLQLSSSGKIHGAPRKAASAPYTFDIRVTDLATPRQTATKHFTLVIEAAPALIIRVSSTSEIPTALRATTGSPPSDSAGSGNASDPPPQPSSMAPPAPASPSPQPSAPSPDPPQPQGTLNCGTGAGSLGGCGGPKLRTIVGFEQAGVSGAQSTQNFFFDLMYDRPLAFYADNELGAALRSWGNLRISSVPQQINTSVAQFATNFAQQVGQLKVNEVAQAFDFLGGVEYRLFPNSMPADYASTDPQDSMTLQRVSLHLIAGGGVITPLSPKDSVNVFAVPTNQPDFLAKFPQAMGKQYVAFSLQDRNRFFRQAYAGFRLKTNIIGDTKFVRFPETFDLTYGFNESVTGGRIRGGVMRLEGFVPIPYKKASWIYFFGAGIFKPGGHATLRSPFFLDSAPAGTLPTNAGAIVIPQEQADRDYYRVGMGIDFVALIKDWSNSKKPQGTVASSGGNGN